MQKKYFGYIGIFFLEIRCLPVLTTISTCLFSPSPFPTPTPSSSTTTPSPWPITWLSCGSLNADSQAERILSSSSWKEISSLEIAIQRLNIFCIPHYLGGSFFGLNKSHFGTIELQERLKLKSLNFPLTKFMLQKFII